MFMTGRGGVGEGGREGCLADMRHTSKKMYHYPFSTIMRSTNMGEGK